MRNASAYYLMLLYLVAVCKPLLPLAADFLAHTFHHTAHIETVHHKQGANHVHKELKAAAEEEKNTKAASGYEAVAIHVPAQGNYDFLAAGAFVPHMPILVHSIYNIPPQKHFPPPKA